MHIHGITSLLSIKVCFMYACSLYSCTIHTFIVNSFFATSSLLCVHVCYKLQTDNVNIPSSKNKSWNVFSIQTKESGVRVSSRTMWQEQNAHWLGVSYERSQWRRSLFFLYMLCFGGWVIYLICTYIHSVIHYTYIHTYNERNEISYPRPFIVFQIQSKVIHCYCCGL